MGSHAGGGGPSAAELRERLEPRYRLGRLLAETAACRVFLARDEEARHPVTVTVLQPELVRAAGPDSVDRALEAVRGVDHAAVPSPLDRGPLGPAFFWTHPHRAGWTIADKLHAHGPAPAGRAAAILGRVAGALASAHRGGVPHLVLTADEVVLTGEDGLLVRGWVVGRLLADAEAGGATLPGRLATHATAPELRGEGGWARAVAKGAAAAADVFALGALGYEVVTGRPASPGATERCEGLRDVLERTAGRDAGARGRRELGDLLTSCLATDPGTRPGLGEVEAALEALALQLGETRSGPPTGYPDAIGPYRIVDRIGEGGMGTVYRARHTDGTGPPVAVKVVRPGVATREVLRRFDRESEALALLDHENVTRIHHASVSAAGRPYFVMDLVEGLSITDYADAKGLDLGHRVALLEQVCRGVQHAHLKGVIHRDLKPANVVVADEDGPPRPRVIDFGLAKVVRPEGGVGAPATRPGQAVGTPEYMSPEQAAGREDVDTRSDIYSLGVLAHELLTGVLPSWSDGGASAPSLTVSSHAERARLADRRGLEPRSLASALRGDLDAIVLRCLEEEPRRRYQTAQELAEDLARYRRSEPVSARAPSLMYRVGKYARRNRAAAVLLGLSAASLLGALVGSTVLWMRAERAEARAAAEAQATDEALNFMTSLFREGDPTRGTTGWTVREALDGGWARVSDLDARPLARAKLYTAFGGAFMGVGEVEQSVVAFRRALDLWEAMGPDPEGGGSGAVAAAIDLSGALANLGRAAQADSVLVDVATRFDGFRARDSLLLGFFLHRRAQIQQRLSYPHLADSLLAEALSVHRAARGPDDVEVARVLSDQASSLYVRGEYAEAQRVTRDGLAVLERSGAVREGGELILHHQLRALEAKTMAVLGQELDAAVERARAAERLMLAVVGEDHPMAAEARWDLAYVLEEAGRLDEAVALYEELVEQWVETFGPRHPNVGVTLSAAAELHIRAGRHEAARRALDEGYPIVAQAMGAESMAARVVELNLGRLELAVGRLDSALVHLEAVMAYRREAFEPGALALADAALPLSRAYLAAGRVEDALPLADEALSTFRRHLPSAHRWVAEAKAHRADLARFLASSPQAR